MRSDRQTSRLEVSASTETATEPFVIWPRRRSTGGVLAALVVLQTILFTVVTRRSFFFHDDYNYFELAQERHLFRYLLTPVLWQYPAPGDRLLSFLLQRLFPLNFAVASGILMIFLAGTTILLWQLVRTLARSDEWWTVALLVPFALSLTLVLPMSWWSAGIPILPALFFTVLTLSAFLRSYMGQRPTFWLGVAVVAMAAAGAFYIEFLVIPIYLLVLRLAILPRLLGLPSGLRQLWKERMRWIALAAPAAAYIAVFFLYDITGKLPWLELSSTAGASRPYLDYFTTAWFRAFVPASFLNARVNSSVSHVSPWILVAAGQVLFWGAVGATWRRSSFALRAWALFVFVFSVNAAIVGTQRLAGYGVADIAYALRYYPEITLFLPLALALGLRQGEERRAELAWERTKLGQTVMGCMVSLYAVSFLVWAPGIVSDSPGVAARSWYGNLRHDIRAVTVNGSSLRILDSETPVFVMEHWMAPDNRVSSLLSLAHIDAMYNDASEPIYLVQNDGHLAQATFRPFSTLLSGPTLGEGVRIVGGVPVKSVGVCLQAGERLLYAPDTEITGERLAIRVFYSGESFGPLAMEVDTPDPNRPTLFVGLHQFQSEAELADLGTSRLRAVKLEATGGGHICFDRVEIGSMSADGA